MECYLSLPSGGRQSMSFCGIMPDILFFIVAYAWGALRIWGWVTCFHCSALLSDLSLRGSMWEISENFHERGGKFMAFPNLMASQHSIFFPTNLAFNASFVVAMTGKAQWDWELPRPCVLAGCCNFEPELKRYHVFGLSSQCEE